MHVEPCNGFDDRFNKLWVRIQQENRHVLICNRNREFLEWHFGALLLRGEIWIVTLRSGAELAGYSIYRRLDNAQYRLKRMQMVDFQVVPSSPALLTQMVVEVLRRCRLEGIHMLEVEDPRIVDNCFAGAVSKRKKEPWPFFYKANTKELADKLKNSSVWCPSLYDGDYVL